MKQRITTSYVVLFALFCLNGCVNSEPKTGKRDSNTTAQIQNKDKSTEESKTKNSKEADTKLIKADDTKSKMKKADRESKTDIETFAFDSAIDFKHFMKLDLSKWEKVKTEKYEEGDAWGTTYQYKRDNQTLKYDDGVNSYGYNQNYKLFDANNKLLKERDFYYSDGQVEERVVDYTTAPPTEYIRTQEKKVAYDLWESDKKPIMASGDWTKSKLETQVEDEGEKNTPFKLTDVFSSWNTLKNAYSPDQNRDNTWLDVGFRAKYAMLKKYASLSMLEKAYGMPVFLSGPHKEDMDFYADDSFGHYNPAFISKLQKDIEAALRNPTSKEVIKKIYHQHLESMARTYQDAYLYVNDGNLKYFQESYKASLGMGDGSMQEEFRDYADNGYYGDNADYEAEKRENPNKNWYEAVTAPAFWVRRSLDGTDKQLFKLLEFVIEEMEK